MPPGSGTDFEFRLRYGGDRASVPWFPNHERPGDVFVLLDVISYEEVATGRTWFNREEAQSFVTLEQIVIGPGRYWFEANIVGPENNFWLTKSRTEEASWYYYEKFGGLGQLFEALAGDLLSRLGYPLGFEVISRKLVATAQHCQAKWNEQMGKRRRALIRSSESRHTAQMEI